MHSTGYITHRAGYITHGAGYITHGTGYITRRAGYITHGAGDAANGNKIGRFKQSPARKSGKTSAPVLGSVFTNLSTDWLYCKRHESMKIFSKNPVISCNPLGFLLEFPRIL